MPRVGDIELTGEGYRCIGRGVEGMKTEARRDRGYFKTEEQKDK